ncbi:MAG: bifunctional methylenetetrahydrofolate dehydrogenase/methenyltetrahydrofolate cyclohydrolase FolD [Actinobacteria bacterium]|nr:MAG: bifunctional methylenetetrahydrofolate dehydrogenase/methenyltetrahydrofolate cyclohydrolase FolD [Actinomycetota bacterium]
MVQIIDGEKIASDIRSEVLAESEKLKKEGITPGLATVLVGENPASKVYVNMKEKDSKAVQFYSERHDLDENITEERLLSLVEELNNNDKIHGILVQLPLPKHIDENKILEAIDPAKDVDGFHPINVGKLVIGLETFLPCTPHGVFQLLKRYNIETDGADVVIIGRSNIVGKPMALILMQRKKGANATVTVTHSATKDLAAKASKADILIAAIGKPKFVTADMVKEGAVVIDVGVNRTEDGLVGDVDFEAVKDKASWITPVPGGVGPMTRAMLLVNTVESAKRHSNRQSKVSVKN